MSITDGQIIFDLGIFRKGVRPAVNAGLSVSRVGGQAQTTRQKKLSSTLFKTLARYRQAEEFSHFSSQLSKETQSDMILGRLIYDALQQPPEKLFSLIEQQLMLETILLSKGETELDVIALKESVQKMSHSIKDVNDEKGFDRLEAELFKKHAAKKLEEQPIAEPAPDQVAPESEDKETKDSKDA